MPKSTTTTILLADMSQAQFSSMIHEFRGQMVMLDSDLAQIYDYSTKAFNQQVKNNIDKFDEEDFMFQLTEEESAQLSRSKILTMNDSEVKTGRGHNIKYRPYAFTEQGIYMLMTVLRGPLATRQTKALIRLFKGMKDYIVSSQPLLGQREYLQLSLQTSQKVNLLSLTSHISKSIHRLDILYLYMITTSASRRLLFSRISQQAFLSPLFQTTYRTNYICLSTTTFFVSTHTCTSSSYKTATRSMTAT